ncbi:pancreatic secretory granule membrane major glycoprotein GP2-like [Chiloscyllium plagiosum]|uniref:pancreatic secretory granule membrane major glycoprotein GP2-like n=1 Tax=Chiloscyllium plagiosum TaxID=36176 RepID=UPI001CB7E735|nr:pancreatic secretory granule membrane major glycoprotein GP2-like [Chiloscyllium plagiosum]
MRSLLLILGLLIPASALTDPCASHTVLDQAWRNINCGFLECLIGLICDDHLQQGWYRFNSSGGWKIPEIVIPLSNCSSWSTGWLNGRHPTVLEGEVTRTVCFNWFEDCCYKTQEIKIKNCSSFFVYELKPAPFCPAVYCTDTTTGTVSDQEQLTTEISTAETTAQKVTETSDTQYQWVKVLITSETEIENEEAKKIAMQKLQEMVNKQAGQGMDLVLEEGYCSAVDISDSERS